MVGGRLKVGDFGLVRNLTDSDASMLEGMTPRYAAPEVFEGRPTRFSDQFSLAVVYAELLTGQPPFDAKSAAQFATQHMLGSKPKLDWLSPAEQVIVARALSKNPPDRFPNCRAFVDKLIASAPSDAALAAARDESQPRLPLPTEAPPPASEPFAGAALRGHAIVPAGPRNLPAPSDDATLVLGGDSSLRQPQSRSTEPRAEIRLPAAECDDVQWAPRPTLLVGLGGAATQVLRGLSQRLAQRFADGKAIPAWKMLAIDTDPTAAPIGNTQPESGARIRRRSAGD